MLSKRSFTLKKIKNIKKKKRCSQSMEEEKLNTMFEEENSSAPIKFLDPIKFHLILSDLVVYDDVERLPGTHISSLRTLFDIKYLVSIDSFDKFLLFNFEDKVSYPISNTDLLLTRLRSLGEKDAYEMSNLLETYQAFWDLMIKIQKNGGGLDILDSVNPNSLNILHKYYSTMVSSQIEEDHWFPYLQNFLEQNDKSSIFCFIYSEFKPLIGMQLAGFIMNYRMRHLIPKSDFELLGSSFLMMEKNNYYKIITKTLESFFSVKYGETFEFAIKTYEGLKKMKFMMERKYLNLKKGGKKIVVFFTEILPKENEKAVYLFEKNYNKLQKNNIMINGRTFNSSENIENNGKWKKLVELYFNNIKE